MLIIDSVGLQMVFASGLCLCARLLFLPFLMGDFLSSSHAVARCNTDIYYRK